MWLSAIYVFPLKSGAPLAVERVQVTARGLAGDRRWMVVDESGAFITGRTEPYLVRVRAEPQGEALRLDAPGMPPVLAYPVSRRETVTIWRDLVEARAACAEANAWIREVLGRPCRLVYMDEVARRPVDPAHGRPGDEVSFADAFPLLLISTASLDALNARLDVPVPMLRFRPNLVVSGTEAHAEDHWTRIRIGALEFEVVKPCVRCGFTTVMPETGTLDPRGEPLRTLATYRRGPTGGVTFGQNLIARGGGWLQTGDAVTVLA